MHHTCFLLVTLNVWSFTTHLQHFPLDDHNIKRICLIKTLLVKNLVRKTKRRKKKRYSFNSLSYSWSIRTSLLKTLLVKPNGTKFEQREKEYNNTLTSFYTPPHVNILKLTHYNIVY